MVHSWKVAACTAVLAVVRGADPDAAAAKEKKMAAVNKAVELMESLQQKVIEEGEAEAKTYDKFACFCKDTQSDKNAAIQKGADEETALTAGIAELSSRRNTLDAEIQAVTDALGALDKSTKAASHVRLEGLKQYEADTADMQAALVALENAIKMLKTSKTPSLVQLSASLRSTLALADALNFGTAKDRAVVAMLQQEPENGNTVPVEDYDFHSDGIIGILEKLLANFRAESVKLDEAEAVSVRDHDIFMQNSADQSKELSRQLEEHKGSKAETQSQIQESSQRLTTVVATLSDDRSYASNLAQMCGDKAKTWDQRSRARASEITILTQAVGIIKSTVSDSTSAATVRFLQHTASVRQAVEVATNPAAMEAIELAVEASPSFLQLLSRGSSAATAAIRRLRGAGTGDGGRALVLDLLSMQGEHLHSTLLTALAGKIAADPLAKIKTLIQELIERLQTEAANESNQKAWCDKAQADAAQKRDYASEEIRSLNSKMASDEATRDTLEEELAELAKAIAEIKHKLSEAQADRDEEHAENLATIEEAKQGLNALQMCIDLLDKFYKTMAKEAVNLSLVTITKGPEDEAPEAGFDSGEAYTGAQGESGGILAMLDVMKSDFERTVSQVEAAEEQARKDHQEFATESSMSVAAKEEAEKAKGAQLDDTTSRLEEDGKSLASETAGLQASLKELMELKPVCIDTGMSYEDRVAAREEEIASLSKAECILGRYAEFGPDGAAEGC